MIHPLPFDEELFREYGARLGIEDPHAVAWGLAAAIACSPGWERYPGCSLLVRTDPAAIAVVGELTAEARSELAAQADALRARCRHFRYVSYAQAEVDCLHLAEALRPLLRSKAWSAAHLLALPRGGHVVLGMLATLLNLPRERLLPTNDPHVPVVLVDDCAMTGARFREHLARLPAEQVAFAHLYSRPELRAAIQAEEPRVHACLAARDLADLTGDATELPAWWDRLPNHAYLRVPSEVACFAWSEPDRVVHRPVDGAILPGWRMIPPALCLKNRGLSGIPIAAQAFGGGSLRPAPGVFFVDGEDAITVAASSGNLLRLEGLAAAAWRAMLRAGDLSTAEALLTEQFEVEQTVLRRDLEGVVAELTELRLLCSNQT